jgi:phage-related protein
MPDLDELQIKIESDSSQASDQVDKLAQSIRGLADALDKLNPNNFNSVTKAIDKLTSTGNAFNTTNKAIKGMANTIAKDFGVRSKKGINEISDALHGVYEATKLVHKDDSMVATDAYIEAINTLNKVTQANYSYRKELDDTTKGVYDFIQAERQAGNKVSLAGMKNEVANYKELKKVLGSSFTDKLSEQAEGLDQFFMRLHEAFPEESAFDIKGMGASGEVRDYSNALLVLKQYLENAKDTQMGFNEAVKEGEPSALNMGNYLDKCATELDKLVSEQEKYGATSGLGGMVSIFSQLNSMSFPGINSLADATRKVAEKAQPTQEVAKAIENIDTAASGAAEKTQELAENLDVKIPDLGTEVEKPLSRVQGLFSKLGDYARNAASTIKEGFWGAIATLELLAHEIERLSKFFDGLANKGISALKLMVKPLQMALGEYVEKFENVKKSITGFVNHFKNSMKKMSAFWKRTKKTFTFMLVRKAITAIISEVNNAIQSMAKFSNQMGTQFNKSISLLVADFQYLGRSIVSVFAPLINIIAPIIDAIVDKIATLLSYVGMLIAALGGSTSFTKAKKTVNNYADSLDNASKSAKNLTMGIDELNILNEDSGSSSGASNPMAEWENVEIPPWVLNLADFLKKMWDDFLRPIKAAWDKVKEYFKFAFKYMVEQVKKLAKSIWDAFIQVWNEPETIEMIANILRIIADLMIVIGNLCKNFREAWDEVVDGASRGVQIFRGIRDIFAALIEHVRNVTWYMVRWSSELDFRPLLDSIITLLHSLYDLADFLGGVFEDVMKNVVLKYIKWMIEDGTPHLIRTIAEVIDAFDFDKIRQDLIPFEEAFERLLENVHTGVTNALGNLGKMIAEFANSQEFTDFMQRLADIMDLISAEDVEKILTGVGKGILDIAESVVKFVNSDAFMNFLKAIDEWLANTSSDDIASIFKNIANAIVIFKFTSFVGEGFVGFIKFISILTTIKNIGDIAGSLKGTAGGLSAIGNVLKIFGGVATVITGVITAIAGFFKMWTEGWSVAGEVIKDVGIALTAIGAVILGVAAAPAAIVAAIVAALTTIVILVHDHWEEICTFFTETIPEWWNGTALPWLQELPSQIGEFFANLWDSIKQWASDKKTAIGEWINTVKTTVSEKISAVIDAIVQWFSELPGKIGYALGYTLGTFVAWGISLVEWAITNIPIIIDNIVTWFVELPGKIGEWLTETINKFVEWGAEVISWIAENVSQFIENIVQWFMELPGKIHEWLSDVINKFVEWKDSVIEWITTEIPLIIDAFVEFFKQIPNKLYELGTDIINGLLNGIKDAWETCKNAVGDFCNNFLQGFKDALGIASPSKEARDIGDYVIEGLFEPFTEDQTSQLLAFTTAFLNVFRTQLSADKFTAIGNQIWQGLLNPINNSSSQFGIAIDQIFQVITVSVQTNLTNLGTLMSALLTQFMQVYILPFFSLERWQPLFDVLLNETFIPFFETFRVWFNEEAMALWWEEDLLFWFTKDKWDEEIFTPLAENIHEHFDTFSTWWDATILSWWENQVIPWFKKELWKEQFDHILEVAKKVFTEIEEVIREHIEAAKNAVIAACNEMKTALEEVLSLIDEVMSAMEGLGHIDGNVQISVSGAFASGGYPMSGSLFIAHEAGPELVGTIGRRTAVASNNEITGIADAVYSTGSNESELLGQLISLTRAILDKDAVVIGDKDIARMAASGQNQLGMSIIT